MQLLSAFAYKAHHRQISGSLSLFVAIAFFFPLIRHKRRTSAVELERPGAVYTQSRSPHYISPRQIPGRQLPSLLEILACCRSVF